MQSQSEIAFLWFVAIASGVMCGIWPLIKGVQTKQEAAGIVWATLAIIGKLWGGLIVGLLVMFVGVGMLKAREKNTTGGYVPPAEE